MKLKIYTIVTVISLAILIASSNSGAVDGPCSLEHEAMIKAQAQASANPMNFFLKMKAENAAATYTKCLQKESAVYNGED